MMLARRVVITGAGTINPLGADVPRTLAAMMAGQSAIAPLVLRDLERLSIKIGAQIQGYDEEARFTRSERSLFDRFTQYLLIAAAEAVAQAGDVFAGDSMRFGAVVGTAAGGLGTWEESYRAVFEDKKPRVHPFVVPKLMSNAGASHLSMRYGLQGPSFAVSSACASSNHAMGLAFQMIRSGMADAMLTGGSEAMLTFGGIKAWEGLRVMSPDGCRPFSATRNGMVQGEGAGVFVFEEYERALARGAVILAEVAGASMTSDAADIVAPSQEGAERAMRAALLDAQLTPKDIGYINAHGTGTAANDRSESAAIKAVFGADAPPVSSTKALHGHLIGGTGAVELLACIMALRESVLAPTVGYDQPDPECALDVVPNVARHAKVQATLSNAFAFGGLNAVIALKAAPGHLQ